MGLRNSMHPFMTHPTYRSLANLGSRKNWRGCAIHRFARASFSKSPSRSGMLNSFDEYFQLGGNPPD